RTGVAVGCRWRPEEGVRRTGLVITGADHLARCVDRISAAELVTRQCTQINHGAGCAVGGVGRPEHGMEGVVGLTGADDLSRGVDCPGGAESSPAGKVAKVNHRAALAIFSAGSPEIGALSIAQAY